MTSELDIFSDDAQTNICHMILYKYVHETPGPPNVSYRRFGALIERSRRVEYEMVKEFNFN